MPQPMCPQEATYSKVLAAVHRLESLWRHCLWLPRYWLAFADYRPHSYLLIPYSTMNAAFKTRAISFFCAIARQPFNPILNVLGCSVIKILLCDVIRKKTRIGIILDVENVLRATCRFRIGKTSHTPRNLYLRAEILYSVRLAEGLHNSSNPASHLSWVFHSSSKINRKNGVRSVRLRRIFAADSATERKGINTETSGKCADIV